MANGQMLAELQDILKDPNNPILVGDATRIILAAVRDMYLTLNAVNEKIDTIERRSAPNCVELHTQIKQSVLDELEKREKKEEALVAERYVGWKTLREAFSQPIMLVVITTVITIALTRLLN